MSHDEWLKKDRSETISNRLVQRNLNNDIKVLNPALGINLYQNVLLDPKKYIDILEEVGSNSKYNRWNPVKYFMSDNQPLETGKETEYHKSKEDPYLRYCVDMRFNKSSLGDINEENKKLHLMYDELYEKLMQCVNDYESQWSIELGFIELFNFVKYDNPKHKFKMHTDDSPLYSAKTTAIFYLNDDFEGGEIHFPRLDYTYKPKAGDLMIFPANYIYEHETLTILQGAKYCVVVAMDFNDRFHKHYQ